MSTESAAKRPNILFFFTDDQRFDTLNVWGNLAIHTPNMDTLARRGVSFTQAHIMGGTSGAVCMPSRAMLMTGRSLFHLEREGQGIPREHVLLGEHLQRQGYRTFGTGKWHNGPESYARSFSDGAEIFFGGMDDHWNVQACDFHPDGVYPERPVVSDPFHSNEVTWRYCDHITAGKHSSELFCDATIDFLCDYDGDQPFLAYVSFMAPHDPRTMPRVYREMYDPQAIALPPNFLTEHPFDNGDLVGRDELLAARPRDEVEIRRHLAEYYAMITHADAQMGRVLEALSARGWQDDTIIVFAGDNGLALGQHGLMGKQNLYDHSVRVPLILAGPGVPSGVASQARCYLYDIYPTLCELAGVPVPDTVDGRSLVPAMRDPADRMRETIYCAYKEFQRSVRDDRYKLVEYVVHGERHTQLFDLVADPWEMHNLAYDPAHRLGVECLRAELLRWREASDDHGPHGRLFWGGYTVS
jgi:arylsulfatase A-like enzyme